MIECEERLDHSVMKQLLLVRMHCASRFVVVAKFWVLVVGTELEMKNLRPPNFSEGATLFSVSGVCTGLFTSGLLKIVGRPTFQRPTFFPSVCTGPEAVRIYPTVSQGT